MEGDETSAQLVESAAPRVQRIFADFRGSHADSSSAATSKRLNFAPAAETVVAAPYEEIGERRRRYRGLMQRPWGNERLKYVILTKQQDPTADMLRDYWQYSQLLQSSTDFHGQEATSLMEQMMQSSQLPNFQHPFLYSSLSHFPSSFVAPSSTASSSSSSFASFPLVFCEHQQLDVFRQLLLWLLICSHCSVVGERR
ncbi:hypothetical protein CXB51_015302 [Gossypium anomalum]|uniref:Uncharacterized protein n=1 Tax=Gossypium anomalum TaxID=47600 RepID=A0A8J6D5J0_9ROSI|nr:hypothetical protein CXB51_015302 [Gossypium anomalum]